MTPGDRAAQCLAHGLSVVPIEADSKKAAVRWERYQKQLMSTGEARQYFVNGRQIALVGGSVSGNLECFDFDQPSLFKPYLDTLEGVNPELWAKLTVWQHTPRGGYHILFRCVGPVGGNQKLAMSARYNDDQGKPRQDVFIETRGEGGYFLVAPSKGYTLHGDLDAIPVVTTQERDLIHKIARSFDENGQQSHQRSGRADSSGDRPGDRFNRETDWRTLLESEGWSFIKTVGNHHHWCRPGKSDGSTSATLNEQGFFVFSSSTPLPTQKPLDKFAFYAYSRFNGDFSAAAKSLRVPDNSGHSGQTRTFTDASGRATDAARTGSGYAPDEKRTLASEVLAFIENDPAPFETKDVYSELCAKSRREKKTISDGLAYYEKQGKIRRIVGKRGCWEVVEDEPEVMDLLSASATPFNISLPLDISNFATVRAGSVILVSGSSNAAKTLTLLSIVRKFFIPNIYLKTPLHLSNERIDVAPRGEIPSLNYLNSEMSAGELATRIRGFGDDPSIWVRYVRFIERSHSFDKLVAPDGVTFIDFLEVNEDFYQAGKFIADIHRRLKGGVAVVAMQKKQGHLYAKGGEMTLEKPRLAINLDRNEPHGFTCKITKCKEPVDFMHSIQGMERDFVIGSSSEILPISDWRFVNEHQRKAINGEYARSGLPDKVKRDRIDYRTGSPLETVPDAVVEGVI